MIDINTTMNYLTSSGLLEFFAPFLLLFILSYIALSLAPFFKRKLKDGADDKEKKKVKGINKQLDKLKLIIALGFSSLMMFQHLTNPGSSLDIVPIIIGFMSNFSIVIIIIFFTLLAAGLVGYHPKSEKSFGGIFALLAVAYVIYLMGVLNNIWPPIQYLSQDFISAVFGILIFVLIIWYITKPEKKGGNN